MSIPGAKLPELLDALRKRYGHPYAVFSETGLRYDMTAHPAITALMSHAEGLAAALEEFAESPARCANLQCHREMCGPEECGRCSRAIAAWRALTGEFD